ncbi:MAG: hypothetical protein JSR11_03865 [Bacteroidetes bacterium]|nr:hypothetical protein [Bacteroidota bacterium]
MFSTDNQIAEFLSSVYKDGFGFDVSVFSNNDNSVTVHSNELLDNTYKNFETFLDDLADKNPLWHTYYFVRIDKKFQQIVEQKLRETIEKVFDNLDRSILSTKDNWRFDNEPMNEFVKDTIQQTINNSYHFEFLQTQNQTTTEEQAEPQELEQVWNGYCPESWLKGKQVKMRLNKNDFYESEETGLQIAVLSGVQAVILNFRGKGDFRSAISYADEIENGEFLSPQNTERPPFNNPTEVFQDTEQIKNYINNIN